jgi:hypothetical protein
MPRCASTRPFGWLFGAGLLEETERFRRVLGVPDRLRLEREAEVRAGAVAQAGPSVRRTRRLPAHDLEFVRRPAEAFERTR